MSVLRLERFNQSTEDVRRVTAGTFGELTLPSGLKLYTCERSWIGNATGKSCVPTGVYTLRYRKSPVVERSSGGEFTHGWELAGVVGRSYIMMHPANWPSELKGCIAVGMDYTIIKGRLAIADSRKAFRKLMAELDPERPHEIHIFPRLIEYP